MTDRQPLAIDLFCGLGGWTEGLLLGTIYMTPVNIQKGAQLAERLSEDYELAEQLNGVSQFTATPLQVVLRRVFLRAYGALIEVAVAIRIDEVRRFALFHLVKDRLHQVQRRTLLGQFLGNDFPKDSVTVRFQKGNYILDSLGRLCA